LQGFDGMVGAYVGFEEMQVRTVGPDTIEREARWPYAQPFQHVPLLS
jgi:hypothetical protein